MIYCFASQLLDDAVAMMVHDRSPVTQKLRAKLPDKLPSIVFL